MRYMSAADGEGVAVTANGQNRQVVIGDLYARRNGQGSAVQRVESVGIQEKGKA